MVLVRCVDVLFAVRLNKTVMKTCASFYARRLVFSSPPFPPGFKKMPVASDAKPFFDGDLGCFSQSSSSSLSSLSGSTMATPHRTTTTPSTTNVTNSTNNDVHSNTPQQDLHHRWSFFLSPETIHAHVPKPAKLAALLAADALGVSTKSCSASDNSVPIAQSLDALRKKHTEHCIFGWSPANFYSVVADVAQYSNFLPWCLDSTVHSVRRIVGDVAGADEYDNCGCDGVSTNANTNSSEFRMEMNATLTVGFSFFKEQYTSRVLLAPNKKVIAVLSEDPQYKRASVLSDLHCMWEFNAIPEKEQQVKVVFHVNFGFKNPLYSKFIMSHVVSLMTRSFEKRCEKLYGQPSCPLERLAL